MMQAEFFLIPCNQVIKPGIIVEYQFVIGVLPDHFGSAVCQPNQIIKAEIIPVVFYGGR